MIVVDSNVLAARNLTGTLAPLQEKFPGKALSVVEFARINRTGGQVREAPVAYRVRRKR